MIGLGRKKVSFVLFYFAAGLGFGIVLTKAQVVSWYRIQEMFHFDSFHMYGIIGSAVAVAAIGLWLIKRFDARSVDGSPLRLPPKELGSGTRYWLGGTIFGLGWGLSGACPGPILALLGSGVAGAVVLLASALLGTWTYAVLRPRLPH